MFTDELYKLTQDLQRDFPATFPKKPYPKVALKIGIHKDLENWAKQNNYSMSKIQEALKYWCRGERYRDALKQGIRIGLV